MRAVAILIGGPQYGSCRPFFIFPHFRSRYLPVSLAPHWGDESGQAIAAFISSLSLNQLSVEFDKSLLQGFIFLCPIYLSIYYRQRDSSLLVGK